MIAAVIAGIANVVAAEALFTRTAAKPTGVVRIGAHICAGCRIGQAIAPSAREIHTFRKTKIAAKVDTDRSHIIRVERQTLLKLPGSGDILFTIRVYVDPVAAFRHHPDGAGMAVALAEQIEGLNEGQARYKGLLADRPRIVAALRGLVDASS